jgi:mannose-6-phosphate isomerase-like protein (cupin superfamily)
VKRTGAAIHQHAASQPGAAVDIVATARSNDAFRREVVTGQHEQVVVMTIAPGAEIGEEVHPDTDQVLGFVDGNGEVVLDGQRSQFGPRTTSPSYVQARATTS